MSQPSLFFRYSCALPLSTIPAPNTQIKPSSVIPSHRHLAGATGVTPVLVPPCVTPAALENKWGLQGLGWCAALHRQGLALLT